MWFSTSFALTYMDVTNPWMHTKQRSPLPWVNRGLLKHLKHATPISHVIVAHYNLHIPQQLRWIQCFTDPRRSWPHIITYLEPWMWDEKTITFSYKISRHAKHLLFSQQTATSNYHTANKFYTLLPSTRDDRPRTHTLVTFDADFEVKSCYWRIISRTPSQLFT